MELLAAAQAVRVLRCSIRALTLLRVPASSEAVGSPVAEVFRRQLLMLLSEESVRRLQTLRREMAIFDMRAKGVGMKKPLFKLPEFSTEISKLPQSGEARCMLGLERDARGRLQTISTRMAERIARRYLLKFTKGTYCIFRLEKCVLVFPRAYRWWANHASAKYCEEVAFQQSRAKIAESARPQKGESIADGISTETSSEITEDGNPENSSEQEASLERFPHTSYHSFILGLNKHIKESRSWNFLSAVREDIAEFLEFLKPAQAYEILSGATQVSPTSPSEEIAREQKVREEYLELLEGLRNRKVFCEICSVETETAEELSEHLLGRRHTAVQTAILEEAEDRALKNDTDVPVSEIAQRLSEAYQRSQLYTSDHYHLYCEKHRLSLLLQTLEEDFAHAQRLARIQLDAPKSEPLYTAPLGHTAPFRSPQFSRRAFRVATETLLASLSPRPLEDTVEKFHKLLFALLQTAPFEANTSFQHAWESVCSFLAQADREPTGRMEDIAALVKKKRFIDPNTGQEVPSWFFEAHQLQKEFPCEICGAKYYGPITFERHFKLPRHQLGLNLLGITKGFAKYNGLGRIEDVRTLTQVLDSIEATDEIGAG